MIGSSIAHYKITAKLGAGGMGEVWRATDERLNRDVAVKLLPESFADDPERMARFRREAQLLASLNHPNIGQVYGLEEQEGRNAIILELIEGDTLADRIARGPISIEETQRLGMQIAAALEAAHEQGIVHRDLKPANIKITPQGEAKVLDFGLAKAFKPDTSQPDLTQSPTLTARATAAGVIMGTAAYMPPEQARGQEVDRRADIWAFGCVLYEMLVGEMPFRGEDVSEVLAHVITQEPDLERLPGALPLQTGEIIRRCLRKDPRKRLPDIAAARIGLEEAIESPQTEGLMAEARPSRPRWVPIVLAGIAGLALGAILLWALGPLSGAVEQPVSHLDLVLEPSPTHWTLALSSDGQTLIYSGRDGSGQSLYVRELTGYDSRKIPGTEGGYAPFFSPDDRHVGFFSAGILKRVSMLGGLPEPICAVPGGLRGAFWDEDDTIVYATNSTQVPHRVDATGGTPERIAVTGLEKEMEIITPQRLPGGRAVLVTIQGTSLDGPRVGVLELTGGAWKILTRGANPLFVAPDSLLYLQNDRLMAVGFDPARLEIVGPERSVPLENPALSVFDFQEGFYAAISATGTLIYPTGTVGREHRVFRLSRDGEIEDTGVVGEAPAVDSSGKRVLVEDPDENIWVADLETKASVQLTFTGTSAYPRWAGDGKSVIFGNRTEGVWRVYRTIADGTGDLEVLVDDIPDLFPTSMVGGTLMGYRVHAETSRDIWTLSPEGDLTMILETDANERAGALAPSGDMFAYVSDEDGSDQIYLRQLPDRGRRWQVSPDGGVAPVWSRDGGELFFRNGYTLLAAKVFTEGAIRVGPPREVFTSERLDIDSFGNRTFDTTPDGGLMLSLGEPDEIRVRVVLNWEPDLTE